MLAYIKEHPYQALILAFALGLVFAKLFGLGDGIVDDSTFH